MLSDSSSEEELDSLAGVQGMWLSMSMAEL